jgi:predicted small metal-binding protein
MSYVINCRDVGIDCDWSYSSEDLGDMLVAGFKHDEHVHIDLLKNILKKMPISDIIKIRIDYLQRKRAKPE